MKPMLAVLLALPSLVSAADLPVRYTLQDKPLKAAIAGTSLSFQLFSDPACTNPPAYSTAVLIENVTLITKLKQFTPKNDTKLPNTDELSVTLPGVTTGGNLYLKVTGTGVVPVGGACQAQAAQVVAPNCVDNIRNQGETDVDCGGPTTCNRCAAGKVCNANGDCQSSACQSGVCLAQATCTDGLADGTETDVDCGGMNLCPRCADGKTCGNPGDCQNSVCTSNVCQAPTCTDAVRNDGETDVDCGGTNACPRCASGGQCSGGSDCQSGICSGGVCVSCTDSIQNDGETDVDCGGSNACPRCADGLNCVVASDCQSSRCVMARCQTPTCTDMVKNGGESDVDCGGATVCPRCTVGRMCLANSDCTSNTCSLGLCQ